MEQAEQLGRRNANRASNSAMEARNLLMDFYNNEGAVDWQQNHLEHFWG
jgi:hypothetical protein